MCIYIYINTGIYVYMHFCLICFEYMSIFQSLSQKTELLKNINPPKTLFVIKALMTKYSHFRFATFLYSTFICQVKRPTYPYGTRLS